MKFRPSDLYQAIVFVSEADLISIIQLDTASGPLPEAQEFVLSRLVVLLQQGVVQAHLAVDQIIAGLIYGHGIGAGQDAYVRHYG